MKRMKIWTIIMVVIMALSGCGQNTKEANNIDIETNEISTSEEVYSVETETSPIDEEIEPSSSEEKKIEDLITEKDDSELNLKSYNYSMEDRTFCDTGEDIFGLFKFDETDLTNYVTTGKVPIYAQNGVKIGYTNENVDIIVMGIYDNWCRFYLNKDTRYARISDIEANSITMDERDAMTEEANKQEETTVKTENPVENVPVEQPVIENPPVNEPIEQPVETPVESDKYTPEEAMSVYRSLMEAGGITWNPALKDGGSWGTGWIYLDKGQAEWAASASLESFAMGDSVGNSWTEFYFEVTGSDEEAVYYTIWSP